MTASRQVDGASEKRGWSWLLVNVCRMVLAVAFIFSGYVKAIDPLGTQYKIQDYLEALGLAGLAADWLTLATSVGLSALEFALGVFLLFAIQRRMASRVTVAFMVVMTLVTVWLAVANPISDCGCFGDAVKLSNVQTLAKNIVLLACALVVAWRPTSMFRFISEPNQWIAVNVTVLFIVLSSAYCLYYLPLFDFRPYHVGANIKQGMQIPEGAEQPEFETTFILRKDGEEREFTLDNYPDSTWEFVDSKSVQTRAGYVPPIHDFSITTVAEGDDITEEVLADEGYTFLLISPHLENADDTNFGAIDQIYEYALEHGYPFYCLTASGERAIEHWRNITGAEYPFCQTDETTLKTIIRSNPGLLLLKNATIIRKWSHNELPQLEGEEVTLPLEKMAIGQLPADNITAKIVRILLWFFLPLLLLSLADRTWAWTKWVRRRKRRKENSNTNQIFKTEKENEKENCSR